MSLIIWELSGQLILIMKQVAAFKQLVMNYVKMKKIAEK